MDTTQTGPGGPQGTGGISGEGDEPRLPSDTPGEPSGEGGAIGDQLGRDLGNLGDEVPEQGDRTFPELRPSDATM